MKASEVGARSRAIGRGYPSQPQIARKRAPTPGNLVNLMGESSVSPRCLGSGSIRVHPWFNCRFSTDGG